MQAVMTHWSESAAIIAGDAHGPKPLRIRPLDSLEHIRTIARSADRQQERAGLRQVLELFDKYALIAAIVRIGEDVRRVVGEADDSEPFLILGAVQSSLA